MRDRAGLERGRCLPCAEAHIECCEYTFAVFPPDDGDWDFDVGPERYRRDPLLKCLKERLSEAAPPPPPQPPAPEPPCGCCGCPPEAHEIIEVTSTEARCLATARAIFAPFDLSVCVRQSVLDSNNMGLPREDFLYGEVGELSFLRLLDRVSAHWDQGGVSSPTGCCTRGVFYDLGCGVGKAVVLAALHAAAGFRQCVGIELLPGLAAASRCLADRYDAEVARQRTAGWTSWPPVTFVEGDMFQAELAGASLVLLNAGSWQEPSLSRLRDHLLAALPDGCVLATIRKPLACAGSPALRPLEEIHLPMSWGVAPVFLAVREPRRAREQPGPRPVVDLNALD